MATKQKWFERKFTFDLGPTAFPLIVKRLRGTPARLEERLATLSRGQLTNKPENTWSIQENAGHLADLEPLWLGRLDDVLSGVERLREADLTNARTHNARHNTRPIEEILQQFRSLRCELVSGLDALTEKQVVAAAVHPRLEQPMRILDLAYFVAEHDDHHLARITELLTGHLS
ncbi:DinB family protein [bacterium]|nr:DinB family protein [bacterium]